MLSSLLLLLLVCLASSRRFSVYHIHNHRPPTSSQQLMYDCLNYYVNDDIVDEYKEDYERVHQIILYCFRPLAKLPLDLHFPDERGEKFTFHQLRMENVSIYQLILWSAPIDLVEQYQIFLNANRSLYENVFYNCTQPWFGPFCQYSFSFTNKSASFSDIIKAIFRQKSDQSYRRSASSLIYSNLSCYTYVECNRGGSYPACLDWREICDGKVDCIDGGIDEQNCDQLEINECKEDEYRCHNGQCIPEDFWRDSTNNFECLDRTDEPITSEYYWWCSNDPAFRCEDVTCAPLRSLKNSVCGDGTCGDEIECTNRRNWILNEAMIDATSNVTDICRLAMSCFSGLRDCYTVLNITKYCPKLFQFPGVPVLYGHVKLLYSNIPFAYKSNFIILPKYICYDAQLCSFVPTVKVDNYSACRRIDELKLDLKKIVIWDNLIYNLKKLFYTCSVVVGGYCQYQHILYTCNSTVNKCISKHRLLDGIQDCYQNDDEQYADSCSLNNTKYRFPCDNKCVSPITMYNDNSDCSKAEDELPFYILQTHKRIYFQKICDGFIELSVPLFIYGENHTDETECNMWPCSNIYTQCNGHWNCLNGADEINCSSSICSSREHMCVSPVNKTLFCLPIERAGNGIVDCRGATDERYLCRKSISQFRAPNFRCSGGTECIYAEELCNGFQECADGDDESFCTSKFNSNEYEDVNLTLAELFLHNLPDNPMQEFPRFSLRDSRIYPEDLKSSYANLEYIPSEQKLVSEEKMQLKSHLYSLAWIWRCNRGLNVLVSFGKKKSEQRCLCPPSYYGDLCQYQNQRVSVTLRVRISSDLRTIFALILTLVDDVDQYINSHDQIEYLPVRDCRTKFNIYLLYSTRPKNVSKKYSIRIHAFSKISLEHRSSWLFPIQFPFLPVYRMALSIIIPVQSAERCTLDCGINGHCVKYENTETYFCRCDEGWSGSYCNNRHTCDCSFDSLCMDASICVCSIHKFGSRCYLDRTPCKPNWCKNDGICILSDIRISEDSETCICRDGFSGEKCELRDTQISITFLGVAVPSSIFIHYIQIPEYNNEVEAHHILNRYEYMLYNRTTTFKKIGIYQNSIIIYRSRPFHMVFIEMHDNYYLTVLQEKYVPSANISTYVKPSHRCLTINEVFNITFASWHLIRRIKYYHLPCQQRFDLVCFHDDTQMCLCNLQHHVNCFEFDHNMNQSCLDANYCENGGQCFQDDFKCPTAITCFCRDCYYGSRCQLSSRDSSLSLNIILGYHILPNIDFIYQPLVIKISAGAIMVFALFGLLSSFLSIVTFQSKKTHDNGCGSYLLVSSVASLLTMIMFPIKFWFLVFSQITPTANRSFLQFNCNSIDFLLRVFLITSEWLHACVAVERGITAVKGASFDKLKSKKAAKWVIIFISLFTTSSSIQDPVNRHLIDDKEQQRIWCVTKYSSSMEIINSVTMLLHFLIPSAINLISAFVIIITVARRRSNAQKQLSYNQHLRQQFKKHRFLLSSSALALLAIPRVVVSFLSDCVKPTREPWLFLVVYFVPFIPSSLVFFIFILPSDLYKKEFKDIVKRIRRKFRCI